MADYLRWMGPVDDFRRSTYSGQRLAQYDRFPAPTPRDVSSVDVYHAPSRSALAVRGMPQSYTAPQVPMRASSAVSTRRPAVGVPPSNGARGEVQREYDVVASRYANRVSPSTPSRDMATENRSYIAARPADYRGVADSYVPPALRDSPFSPFVDKDEGMNTFDRLRGVATASKSTSAHSFITQASRLAPQPSTPVRNTSAYTSARAYTPNGRSTRDNFGLLPSSGGRIPTSMPGLLPPTVLSRSRPLLILDLDETLVHASVERRATGHDFQFFVDMGRDSVMVYVKVRPYVEEFLRRMSQLFEVCIFTASVSAYADKVIDRLDPQRRYIHHRLYREHCTFTQGCYVKDLSRLGRTMERLCLVDNSPITYAMQPENGVPIISWFDDMRDAELMRLTPALEHFARCGNFFETARLYNIVA